MDPLKVDPKHYKVDSRTISSRGAGEIGPHETAPCMRLAEPCGYLSD